MPNILDQELRNAALDEIKGFENRNRKNESLRRYDIYQKRQARYLREKLVSEYSEATVREMRIISSINLARRLVDKKSSLYLRQPTRKFRRSSGIALTENEQLQLENLYEKANMDLAMKRANRYYTLESQCALQIIPREGVVHPRVLLPHHYDVIPDEFNPDRWHTVIISVYDRSLLYNNISFPAAGGSNYYTNQASDQINQIIADQDDEKMKERFIWWSADYNFVTNGHGMLVDPEGNPMSLGPESMEVFKNPIGMLPFVDIASEKEFEYWVRQGSGISDFSLDFGVMLSDTAEVNKRQAYSQAIVSSEEAPKDMLVGPHKVLHMKQDPNKEIQPKFEWASPNPNLDASIRLLEISLALFITSEGVDPKAVTTKLEGLNFNSGYERLLAMIEQFEASEDDMSLFRGVEKKTLKIMAAWSNLMQGARAQDGGGVAPLISELQLAQIPDDIELEVLFGRPENVQTDKEVEDREIAKLEAGLTSRARALMKIHKVPFEEAIELLKEIEEEVDVSTQGEAEG